MVPTLMQSPKALARALKKLNAEQGLVARRNARRLVLTTLSRVRRQLDEEFPRIAPKMRPPRSQDPASKRRRWERRGYVQMHPSWAPAMVAAGLRCKTLSTENGAVPMVPEWVAVVFEYGSGAGGYESTLRKLKRDPVARKMFMVEHALRQEEDQR